MLELAQKGGESKRVECVGRGTIRMLYKTQAEKSGVMRISRDRTVTA